MQKPKLYLFCTKVKKISIFCQCRKERNCECHFLISVLSLNIQKLTDQEEEFIDGMTFQNHLHGQRIRLEKYVANEVQAARLGNNSPLPTTATVQGGLCCPAAWLLESIASPVLHLQINPSQQDPCTDRELKCQEAKQANIKQNKMKMKVYSTCNYEIILVSITPPSKFQVRFVPMLTPGWEE